jgi:hypothetical protein
VFKGGDYEFPENQMRQLMLAGELASASDEFRLLSMMEPDVRAAANARAEARVATRLAYYRHLGLHVADEILRELRSPAREEGEDRAWITAVRSNLGPLIERLPKPEKLQRVSIELPSMRKEERDEP